MFKELGILEEKTKNSPTSKKDFLNNEFENSPHKKTNTLENCNKTIINSNKENALLIKQLQEELLYTIEFKIKNLKKRLEKEYFKNSEQERKISFYFIYLNIKRKNKIYNKEYGIAMYYYNTKLQKLNFKINYYKEFIRDCNAKIKNLFNLLTNFKFKLFSNNSAYNEKINIDNLIKNVEEKTTTLCNKTRYLEKDLNEFLNSIDLFLQS